MATTCSIVDKENLRAVLNRIMLKYQLQSQDVKPERSKIEISDRGTFKCDCVHEWISSFSWIRFDLRNLEIDYKWKMKCKFCLLKCEPTFHLPQIEVMFEKAVCFYKGVPYVPAEKHIGYLRFKFHAPHLPQLCEKCGWGATQCWLHKYNN